VNSTITNMLLALAVIVTLLGFLVSLVMIRRQQHREKDHGLNSATAKHYLLLNPALWAYVLFPVLIVLGAYLMYVYIYK